MNAASSVHGQPAWISSTGWCGWRLSRSNRPAGRACATRLSGSPPPEWMCTGTPLAEATSSVRSSRRSRTGLACARVSRKPSCAPARERAAGVGGARVLDVEARAVGDHRLEGHGALGGGRLEARAERVFELVVAGRAVALLGDPRLDAHDAVHGDAGLALELGARDDRQRKALVDDEALDAGVAPELLQVAGRIGAQPLEPGGADGLVRRLAAEVRRPGARAARARAACSRSRARSTSA